MMMVLEWFDVDKNSKTKRRNKQNKETSLATGSLLLSSSWAVHFFILFKWYDFGVINSVDGKAVKVMQYSLITFICRSGGFLEEFRGFHRFEVFGANLE